jgi:hypothetical protein
MQTHDKKKLFHICLAMEFILPGMFDYPLYISQNNIKLPCIKN